MHIYTYKLEEYIPVQAQYKEYHIWIYSLARATHLLSFWFLKEPSVGSSVLAHLAKAMFNILRNPTSAVNTPSGNWRQALGVSEYSED